MKALELAIVIALIFVIVSCSNRAPMQKHRGPSAPSSSEKLKDKDKDMKFKPGHLEDDSDDITDKDEDMLLFPDSPRLILCANVDSEFKLDTGIALDSMFLFKNNNFEDFLKSIFGSSHQAPEPKSIPSMHIDPKGAKQNKKVKPNVEFPPGEWPTLETEPGEWKKIKDGTYNYINSDTFLHMAGSLGLASISLSLAVDTGLSVDSERKGEMMKIYIDKEKDKKFTWWTPNNAMTVCCLVLIFGVVIMCLTAFLGRNEKSEDYTRFNLITLVIIASIFLVVAGYTEQQIVPVTGLLATIVGYVLGSHKKG